MFAKIRKIMTITIIVIKTIRRKEEDYGKEDKEELSGGKIRIMIRITKITKTTILLQIIIIVVIIITTTTKI